MMKRALGVEMTLLMKSFVRIRQYIMRLLKVLELLMEKIRTKMQGQFQAYSLMPLLLVLTITLVTIIYWMQSPDLNIIIR